MTTQVSPAAEDAVRLPRDRSCPYAPPDGYAQLRERRPVARLTLADGSQGWLLTRYEDVRAMLSDARFSSRDRTISPAVRVMPPELLAQIRSRPSILSMDPPEHTRLRRLLTGQFSVPRMRQLRPRVRRIVLDHLLAMVAAGPPADLVGAFALPIPSLVICELLGVPYEDRGGFQALSRALLSVRTDPGEAMAAGDNLTDYMSGLVRRKRAEPTDDMLSGLVNPQDPANELTEEELTSIGSILLIAGHETTANMISLSVFMLLQRRGTWEGLVRAAATTPPEEESAASASVVEELLRHLSVVQFGLNRTALEDVELGGQLIRAGEVVIGAVSAANHDPERFPEPDRLELDRARPPHVAFGHGVHQCLGQQLARLELRTVFTELPRRLPTLRLAVPAAEVPMKHEMIIYGAAELPVEWDLP